jgi:hypothetical protein
MKERPMRRVFCILTVFGMVSPALAADYDLPILRGTAVPAPVLTVGPATFTRWSGFYFGGAFSYGSATSDFSTATRPLVHFSLQHTTIEDQAQPSQFECWEGEALLYPASAALSVTICSGKIW